MHAHRKLPHDVPSWVQQGTRHFITINCATRGTAPLTSGSVAQHLLDSAQFYEEANRWFLWVMLVMPDHVHIIATFDLSSGIKEIVTAWKRYQTTHLRVAWQENFFEHRLRNRHEFEEKAGYIRMNPVRARLVERPEMWPYVIDRSLLDSERVKISGPVSN